MARLPFTTYWESLAAGTLAHADAVGIEDAAGNYDATNVEEALAEVMVVASSGGVTTTGTPVVNDFARFSSASTIEGRSYEDVRTDLGLPEFVVTDLADAQTRINAAEAAGGGVVSFAVGGTISTGLVVDSDNVHLRGNGVTLTASGAIDMITLRNVKNCSVDGFRINGNWQTARGIALEGALYCKIGTHQGISGDAFNDWMFDLRADGAATQNTAGCEFGNLVVDNVTRFMHFKGQASPLRTVANNNFHGGLHAISAASVDTIMFDFEAYADNNTFNGVVRIQLQRAGDIGIRYNTDATMREVYENHFWGGLLADLGASGCKVIDAYNTQHDPVVGYTYVFLRQGGSGSVSTTADSTVEVVRLETGGNRLSFPTKAVLDSANVISVPGSAFSNTGGSATLSNVNRVIVGALDSTNIEWMSAPVSIPDDWTTADVTLRWANGGAGAGDVVWQVGLNNLSTSISAAAMSSSVTATAGSQNAIIETTIATGVSVSTGSGGVVVNRQATDAADTLGNDAYLVAVRLTKAS